MSGLSNYPPCWIKGDCQFGLVRPDRILRIPPWPTIQFPGNGHPVRRRDGLAGLELLKAAARFIRSLRGRLSPLKSPGRLTIILRR